MLIKLVRLVLSTFCLKTGAIFFTSDEKLAASDIVREFWSLTFLRVWIDIYIQCSVNHHRKFAPRPGYRHGIRALAHLRSSVRQISESDQM